MKILKKYFGYGIANHHFFHTKQSYNLDKYLFDWDLKGANEQQIHSAYLSKIDEIREFLKWDFSNILDDLKVKMHEYAKKLEFEKAAETKKYIESIESLEASQIVRDGIKWNYDIINHIEKYEKNFIWLIEIRDTKKTMKELLGKKKHENIENFVSKIWKNEKWMILTVWEKSCWEGSRK